MVIIKFNKKAQIVTMYKAMHWIYVIMMIGLFMIVFMLVANKYVADLKIIPDKLDNNILIERFVSSRYCFAEFDDLSQKVRPLHIDMSKFNDLQFEKCYFANDKQKAFRLTIEQGKMKKTIKSNNWNSIGLLTLSKRVYINGKIANLRIEVKSE